MELVVVNGASNISKSVIRNLTRDGVYSKVRLIDFRPFRKSTYAFQKELRAQNVELDKRVANSGMTLEKSLEDAEHLLYFTHDYTAMSSGKNNFLEATAKLAKKHGAKSMLAVCPVEHDLAYSENGEDKSWS